MKNKKKKLYVRTSGCGNFVKVLVSPVNIVGPKQEEHPAVLSIQTTDWGGREGVRVTAGLQSSPGYWSV